MTDLRALTTKPHWTWCITDAPRNPKRVENRDRALATQVRRRLVGARIALHAGLEYDALDVAEISLLHGLTVPRAAELVRGAIVAVATIVGVAVHGDELPEDQRVWFRGPYGIVLSDVLRLARPIWCAGALGFWKVPADVAQLVLADVGEARAA